VLALLAKEGLLRARNQTMETVAALAADRAAAEAEADVAAAAGGIAGEGAGAEAGACAGAGAGADAGARAGNGAGAGAVVGAGASSADETGAGDPRPPFAAQPRAARAPRASERFEPLLLPGARAPTLAATVEEWAESIEFARISGPRSTYYDTRNVAPMPELRALPEPPLRAAYSEPFWQPLPPPPNPAQSPAGASTPLGLYGSAVSASAVGTSGFASAAGATAQQAAGAAAQQAAALQARRSLRDLHIEDGDCLLLQDLAVPLARRTRDEAAAMEAAAGRDKAKGGATTWVSSAASAARYPKAKEKGLKIHVGGGAPVESAPAPAPERASESVAAGARPVPPLALTGVAAAAAAAAAARARERGEHSLSRGSGSSSGIGDSDEDGTAFSAGGALREAQLSARAAALRALSKRGDEERARLFAHLNPAFKHEKQDQSPLEDTKVGGGFMPGFDGMD